MRRQYESCLSLFYSRKIRQYRIQHHLTQEQIAEHLCMTPRSYADLEHGICGCSCLTLTRFLALLDKDGVLDLVKEAKKEMDEVDDHVPV